jgi:hypothetical protein
MTASRQPIATCAAVAVVTSAPCFNDDVNADQKLTIAISSRHATKAAYTLSEENRSTTGCCCVRLTWQRGLLWQPPCNMQPQLQCLTQAANDILHDTQDEPQVQYIQ